MIDRKKSRLSLEILGDLAISLAAAVFLCSVLIFLSLYIVDGYLSAQNIELTEIDYDHLTGRIFNISILLSAAVLIILFLILLGQRLSYISEILKGIESLRLNEENEVEVKGNNELSDLAGAVNYLSETQRRVRAEEDALSKEKEELIRSLSHDIRTPLTSIVAYSDLLTEDESLPEAQRREYLSLIRKKGLQIKELTDILLDGGARKLEEFPDARLLFAQLADEFESLLEDEFDARINVRCPAFSARFDVRELQRIFDNLISNIRKYADPSAPVGLSISMNGKSLVIEQKNTISATPAAGESHGMGLLSIRRIAGLYGGRAEVSVDGKQFEIKVVLTDIL